MLSLTQEAPEFWSAAHDMPLGLGVSLPVKSAVIRLPSKTVVVISPVPRIRQWVDEINAIGEVVAIVAPMSRHHLGLPDAIAAWPQAAVFGGRAVQAKRPEILFRPLTGVPEPLWVDGLDQVHVDGFENIDETVFFHRPSSTLYLSDLAFNPSRPRTPVARLLMRLLGGWGRMQFLALNKLRIDDRTALRRTIDQLLVLKPQRIVMCHGETVTQNATSELRRAFEFLKPA